MKIPQFMIAAPSSNAGKTTITLGLLRALERQGNAVQAFKCGPDYLDVIHHTRAARCPGINLDLFMSSPTHVQHLYEKHCQDKDLAIVEGVMGLFDGAVDEQTSSAAIAKHLKLPVILVVDAQAMAHSVGALLHGFKHFDAELKLVGVIFNFVNSSTHYDMLRSASEKVGVTALGHLPFREDIQIPSRYLGLNVDEDSDLDTHLDRLADHVEEHLDLEKLLSLSQTIAPKKPYQHSHPVTKGSKTIAIARDEAFRFLYAENIATFCRLGKVVYFSPIHDKQIPEADLVYLVGGYPELHAKALAQNTEMLQSIWHYCSSGGHVLAECGGFMYLGNQIITSNHHSFSMVDFLPIITSMQESRLNLGYRQFEWNELQIRGHEFHYSKLTETGDVATLGTLSNAKNKPVASQVFCKQNVIASYVHFYWSEQEAFLTKWMSQTS